MFVRFQGCRIGCHWCDTKYTWPLHLGHLQTPEQLYMTVRQVGGTVNKITITGGEPMEQWGDLFMEFLTWVRDANYKISMETGGCHDLLPIISYFPMVNLVVDYKLPSARTVLKPHFVSFPLLRETDVVKIVAGYDDLGVIASIVNYLRSEWKCRARFVVSPIWDKAADLERYVIRARLEGLAAIGVGLNLQMHKFIWSENVRDEEESGENNSPSSFS